MPLLDGHVQHEVRSPESEKRNDCLHEDALQNVLVNVMAECVSKHGFNFFRRVIVEQRISEDDAARGAKARERSVRLLAFLRKIPLVDATDARACTLAAPD